MFTPPSQLDNISFPAIVDTKAGTMLSILFQLEQSQWWPAESILEQQMKQLKNVLEHAVNTVPFYQNLYQQANIDISDIKTYDDFRNLPIVTRIMVQEAGQQLVSNNIPAEHGNVFEVETSGSSGTPVKIKATGLTQLFWNAFILRDHFWQKRDFNKTFAVFRLTKHMDTNQAHVSQDWGKLTRVITPTGNMVAYDVRNPVEKQVNCLLEYDPGYLLTFPSNAFRIASRLRETNQKLTNLKGIMLISENMTPEIRQLCTEVFNVPIADIYSSAEVGYMAFQCPDHDHYHIQSEGILLEILDNNDQPCKPGQIGRVVISTLHNFASPLIRYANQDYAEVGESCDCNRGLPVIKRILGRERNMITYPNGKTSWPFLEKVVRKKITPATQFQIIQKTRHDLELRLVISRDTSAGEERKIIVYFQEHLGYPFNITIKYFDKIDVNKKNGKFEDFMSELV